MARTFVRRPDALGTATTTVCGLEITKLKIVPTIRNLPAHTAASRVATIVRKVIVDSGDKSPGEMRYCWPWAAMGVGPIMLTLIHTNQQ